MKKILITGFGQKNFLLHIYEAVKNRIDVQIDIDNYYSIDSGESPPDNKVFDNYLHLDQIEPKLLNPYTWFKLLTFPFSFDRLLLVLIALTDFKNTKPLLKRAHKVHLVSRYLKRILNSYDIIHLQFVSPKALLFFNIKGIKSKLVCSFWGSDLFRTYGLFNYYIQSKILKKFDVIQIGPDADYAQIFYYKFGFHYRSRIRYYKIWNNDEVLNSIKHNSSPEIISKFKSVNQIPGDRFIIQVGHNGDKNNNHLPIIESLSDLNDDIKAKLFIVLPFTYLNKDQDYYNNVISLLNNSEIEFKILDKFLTVEEIGALRNTVDAFIHLPVSDGLNNTLREYIYAQKFVITGYWLPYKILKRQGAYYESVEDFKFIKDKLLYILNEFATLKPGLSQNRKVIEDHHTEHACIDDWINIYTEVSAETNRLFSS